MLSCAACCHAEIGIVAAGSCFAFMQSMGACGQNPFVFGVGFLFAGIPAGIWAGIYVWPYF